MSVRRVSSKGAAHMLETRIGRTEIQLIVWPRERAMIGAHGKPVLVLAPAASLEIRRAGRPTRGVWVRFGCGALDSLTPEMRIGSNLRITDIGKIQVRFRADQQGQGCAE